MANRICGKLPDCTAIINISGSSRVMTNSSQKTTVHKYEKIQSRRRKMLFWEATEAFINSISCLMLKADCENSPSQCSYQFVHPSGKLRWHRVELLPTGNQESSQVKTYEVWLEQWMSSSPCYLSLGEEREIQKEILRKPINCFFPLSF